jgi:hypothetical protein
MWHKCGKPNCVCALRGHRGHGPQWNLIHRKQITFDYVDTATGRWRAAGSRRLTG